MKHNSSIFTRILILVFTLTMVLSVLFIFITYLSTIDFYEVSTQLLNKDVAAHIAKFTSPFENEGLNKQKADSVFYQAMVISPNAEVYFLDTTGNVIYYHGLPKEIKRSNVPIQTIKQYIGDSGQTYLKGADPRDPEEPKIFSAALVKGPSGALGYIYVIFGSKEYRHLSDLLFKSKLQLLLLKAFILILITAIAVSWLYVNRLKKNFRKMIGMLEKFESGDLKARFPDDSQDDLAPVTHAFNKMAAMLVQNIEKLKKAEIERKDFTAGISHDLRTPLSIARGYAETLALHNMDHPIGSAEQLEYLKNITTNIHIVESRVQQLLDLSKIESPALTLNRQPFVFAEIVQELVHSAKLLASSRGISIDCINCEEISWVSADIHLMERVIQNLLDNAIKFTSPNERIRINITKEEDHSMRFAIENHGYPISNNLLDWLNDSSVDVTAKKPRTSGLGLIILKTILQLHEFPLRVVRKDEMKNIFSFAMPLVLFPASDISQRPATFSN